MDEEDQRSMVLDLIKSIEEDGFFEGNKDVYEELCFTLNSEFQDRDHEEE